MRWQNLVPDCNVLLYFQFCKNLIHCTFKCVIVVIIPMKFSLKLEVHFYINSFDFVHKHAPKFKISMSTKCQGPNFMEMLMEIR